MNSPPIAPFGVGSSTRPYLIRALHDWCTDNGFTPYIAVHVDAQVRVPMDYVKNDEIVLNVGFEATTALKIGNEAIEFKARFGGVSREIAVPVDHVIAIYARENGQGMAFPAPIAKSATSTTLLAVDVISPAPRPDRGPRLASSDVQAAKAPRTPKTDGPEPTEPGSGKRPPLKRIK